ncbi:Uncharacterized protein APZ42_014379, partial [Daphnia magna]
FYTARETIFVSIALCFNCPHSPLRRLLKVKNSSDVFGKWKRGVLHFSGGLIDDTALSIMYVKCIPKHKAPRLFTRQ